MEKNEVFRNKVLSHLYGMPDPAEPADTGSGEDTLDSSTPQETVSNTKEDKKTEKDTEKEETPKETDAEDSKKTESDSVTEKEEEEEKKEEKEEETADNNNESSEPSATVTAGSENTSSSTASEKASTVTSVSEKNSTTSEKTSTASEKTSTASEKTSTTPSKTTSTVTSSTPTTTTSHLYSVLMAPLDGRPSPYRGGEITSTRTSSDDTDASQRKRPRLDNAGDYTGIDLSSKPATITEGSVGMDLTKNKKRKLKKKRRKHLLNKLEVQRAKEFIYSSENEQYTVEKLRTMIEDVTEFLDAIWDVYCSEARLRGESVEEDGYRAAAVLKCLSASGEGSWTDLKLLSRAKSVLVLHSKNLAASTISRVENELGYDPDIRTFIVRMLRFWMDEIMNKG